MKKSKNIDQESLLNLYIDYYLNHNEAPKSVYLFAKNNGFEESQFYAYFSSFKQLENHFFTILFEQSIELLEKNEEYAQYDVRTKVLSFYFTFFEMLSANRSFVIAILNETKMPIQNIAKLAGFRTLFKNYIQSLAIEKLDLKKENLNAFQDKSINEAAWIQFLYTLKFWMEDTSKSFEKTDIFIEKAVHASFDLIQISPLKSILDLGKFIWKEKVTSKV